MLKVLCIFVDESHRLPPTLNHFYCIDESVIGIFKVDRCYLYNEEGTRYYGIYYRKHFMTMQELAEWREQQMKSILDE
jgi:hypothetical protein